jgi:imidazolonepropionase-like amidohydrolase
VSGATLFQNVRIYDGTGKSLSAPSNVLVRGNRIERISRAPIPFDPAVGSMVIDGGGRTLMPGLIDAHWHTLLVRPRFTELLIIDVGYLNVLGAAEATATL